MYERHFTLRHTFDKISTLGARNGPIENHFGVPWCIYIEKTDDHLDVNLSCEREKDVKNRWLVTVSATFIIEKENEKEEQLKKNLMASFEDNIYHGIEKFCDWDTVMENYVKNDKLAVRISVCIVLIKGLVPKRKRNFDESEEHMTDVVLAVGDRKFNVSKVILAEFSDFFKPLFFNGCKESKQSEITLKEVDPDTFQMVLEVIYGKPECIQEVTVEDILHLARQYQMTVVTSRCEEFMIHNKEVKTELKYRLASQYKLLNLQDHLVSDIKKIDDADKVFKTNFKYMDKDFCMKALQNVYN